MAVAYSHLTAPTNRDSGLADKFYFAPVSAFEPDGIKCPVPSTTLASLVTISTDHVFKTGEGFIEVITKPFQNSITAPTSGEIGSLKFQEKLEVTALGSYAELHATMAKLLNEPVIILIKDSDCAEGSYYQLGCDCMFAWVESAEFTTGSANDGVKGYRITFNYSTKAVQLYTGAVVTQGSTP